MLIRISVVVLLSSSLAPAAAWRLQARHQVVLSSSNRPRLAPPRAAFEEAESQTESASIQRIRVVNGGVIGALALTATWAIMRHDVEAIASLCSA
mmetsp:Transcript_9774/g.25994  ORF Transcript_9774/g.25994 Transcript_9774/m.25994 type:complete len:95 (-) Transcript_9774:315-599(-)